MAGGLTATKEGEYPPLTPPFQENKQTYKTDPMNCGTKPVTISDPKQKEVIPSTTKLQDSHPSSDLPSIIKKDDKSAVLVPTPPRTASQIQFGVYPSNIPEVFKASLQQFNRSKLHPIDPARSTRDLKRPPAISKSAVERYYNTSFIPPSEGLPSVSFDLGTKERLIAKVNFVLIAKFSHGKPKFREFQQFLSNFKFKEDFVVSLYDSKHVFIEFSAFHDFVKLWTVKSCLVMGYRVRFFQWNEKFCPTSESSLAPVWILLPGLPLYLLEEEALLAIASKLGKPLLLDPLNLTHKKVGAACICVAVDMSRPLPEAIWITFKEDEKNSETIFQKIVYHDPPPFCKACQHLGHNTEDCKIGVKIGNIKRNAPYSTARTEAASQEKITLSNTGRNDPMTETDALNTLHNYVSSCVSGTRISDTGIAEEGNREGTAYTVMTSKDVLIEEELVEAVYSEEGEIRPSTGSSKGVQAVLKETVTTTAEVGCPSIGSFVEPTTPIRNSHQSKQPIGGQNPLLCRKIVADQENVSASGTQYVSGTASVASHNHTNLLPQQVKEDKNKQLPTTQISTPRHLTHNGDDVAKNNGAPQITANKETQKSSSPSWSDVVETNLPMDFSIPPFQRDDVLVKDREESSEEDDSSDEGESHSSDEELSLDQKLEKFEKVSKDLSSAKNTRIICKKHALADIEKGSYSEEEEAERVPEDFNLDPLMEKNGEQVRLSKLVETRVKLIRQRSASPVGRPSTKLKNLQIKLGSIDLEDNSAILMSTNKYEETQRIKVTRRINHSKEVCNTPKRRGRPPKKQVSTNQRPGETHLQNTQEPRKRGRPKKKM